MQIADFSGTSLFEHKATFPGYPREEVFLPVCRRERERALGPRPHHIKRPHPDPHSESGCSEVTCLCCATILSRPLALALLSLWCHSGWAFPRFNPRQQTVGVAAAAFSCKRMEQCWHGAHRQHQVGYCQQRCSSHTLPETCRALCQRHQLLGLSVAHAGCLGRANALQSIGRAVFLV